MSEIQYLDLAGLTEFKEELDRVRQSDNLNITEALNDISGSIGNGTLTIKKNNVSQGTFTANLKTNSEINISVPTNITDLGLTAITEIQNLIRYGQLDVSSLTNELKLALHESIASTYDYLSEADVEDKLEAYGKIIHYDSSTLKIQLKNGNTVLSEFSAADFISDGMIEDVRITSGTGDNVGKTVLLIDFNTDSGITDIEIPLEDIFDASNYYTKTEVDNLLPDTLTQSEVNTGTDTTGKLVSAKIIKDSIDNANSTGVRIIILSSAPTSSTTTYTINGVTYNFKIGDEVRVANNDIYTYYKLDDLITEDNTTTAVWNEFGSGSGGSDFHATITVTLQSIVNNTQTSATDLNGATVTVTDAEDSTITYSKTWAGEVLVFDGLTPLRSYTITTSNVTGYTTPTITSVTNIGIGVTVAKTAQYTASRSYIDLTMNCTIDNVTSSLPSGAKAYVSVDGGTAVEYTGASNTIQVDAGSDVEITFASVDNYQTPSTISISSASEGTIERSGTYAATTYTVNINTNQGDNTVISAATVSMTFGSTSASYTGAQSNQTILVPANVTPATSNITASSVTNYTASKTIDGNNILVQYQAEKVVVTLTNDSESTDDGGVVYCQNQTVTINGNTVTATETSTNVWQAIAYVAFGTEYSIVYGSAGTWKGNNDYTAPASVTNRTASQATYSVTGQYLIQRGTLYTVIVSGDNQSGASGAANGCTLTLSYTDSNSVAHTETINYPTTTSFLVPNGSTNVSLTGADKSVTDGVFAADVSLSGTAYTITYKATKLTVTRTNGGGLIHITAYSSSYSILQGSSSSSRTVYVKWGYNYSILAFVDTDNSKYPSSTSGMSGTANTTTASASITYSTYDLVTSGYVDLGLPSGTKWAATNVGASSHTSSGTEYAWVNALGQESGNHKLPSCNDAKEFISNCIRVSTTISSVSGYLYISKNNGKAIFNTVSYTWTCSLYSSYSSYALFLTWNSGGVSNNSKSYSLYVRLVEKPTGIKAYYSDGTFSSTGTSSAIGVYVCTSNACFMIPKSNISSNSGKSAWDSKYSTNGVISGVYATDASNTAKTDYAGLVNQEYLYNTSSGCEAAKACYDATVTGYTGTTYRGYLGSCGEWNEAYANKSAINSMMTAIGGTAISIDDYYWTSTLYSSNGTVAWGLYWTDGVYSDAKSGSFYVRPFYRV